MKCTTCSRTLNPATRRRKTTLCKPCVARRLAADPAKLEKCRIAMKARLADPEEKARHVDRMINGIRRAMRENPEFAAQRRESGRRLGLRRLGAPSIPAGAEPRVRAGRKASATKMAWCPLEYREHYRTLQRQHLGPGEARRLIEELIQKDRQRYRRTGQLPVSSREARA